MDESAAVYLTQTRSFQDVHTTYSEFKRTYMKESDKPTKLYKFSYKSGHGITCEDLDDKPRNVSFKLFNGEVVDSDSYRGDSMDIEGIMITNVKGIFEKG